MTISLQGFRRTTTETKKMPDGTETTTSTTEQGWDWGPTDYLSVLLIVIGIAIGAAILTGYAPVAYWSLAMTAVGIIGGAIAKIVLAQRGQSAQDKRDSKGP